ncbi:hypothetical protein [Methanoregula formicica]|uniref:Uncharacterized protein n=1 Tax=Methanoregula formicica (strain DSM 22288 / NBRC 105244 / SMSP) TaxID=593750 RepID=L0HIF3_METFS|nr:hypothetical protein [Methanoregula formicica]AGB03805.1 hypothetical protein Metfor_2822 [Methanoregula formicica SMSP]
MLELFHAMMKEEWRVHSTMFGSLSFALFPFMIFGIAFMGAFLVPLMQTTVPAGSLTFMIHGSYLMLGIMVGGFGLLGNEVMNRRFGQASLLAYSARSLPLSEKLIFANFVVKDTVYYFFLWVLPFGLGYLLATPWTGVPLTSALLLLLTLSLAFLYGLSMIFFLSTVYARSKVAFWIFLLACLADLAAISLVTGANPALLFPPLLLGSAFTLEHLLVSCLLPAFLFIVSLWLFLPESVGSEKTYRDSFGPLAKRLSFLPNPPLAAKDTLDLYRSGSMIGQTIFSFILPLAVIWFFLSLLGPFFPPHGLLMIFAITAGVIASTMYTWVTMFDTFGPYACLPVAVSTLIESKLTTFAILQLIPAAFIAAVAILAGEAAVLVPAVVLGLSVSFYAVAVMAWLAGLSPSVMVYDVKVLAWYLVLTGIVLVLFTAAAFANPYYALASVVLAIPAWWFIQKAKVRWDAVDPAGF